MYIYIYVFLVAFFFRENTFRKTFSGRKYVSYRSVSKVERLGKVTHLQPLPTWPTEDSGRASPLPLKQGNGKL